MLPAAKTIIDFFNMVSSASASAADPDSNVRRIRKGLSHGWQAAKRYRRLDLMSDRELAKLGLDRASIGRYAFFGEPQNGQR